MNKQLAVLSSWRGLPVDPMTDVAGLPLLLRAVLTLQRAGVARIVIALPKEARAAFDKVKAEPRVTADLQFAPLAPHASPSSACPKGVRSLLASYEWLGPVSLYRAMLDDEADSLYAMEWDREGGPMILTPSDWTDLSLAALIDRDDISPFDATAHWLIDTSTLRGQREATRALFDDCRKPVDGIVSRHLNRHISLFLSRLVVGLPISPNMMTATTFGVAIIATAFAAQGSYGAVAIGAVLMQLNSILDGCDGELARVRFEGSKLGQWLDTVGDDLSNIVFWAGLGFGAQALQPYGSYYALGGWVAATSNAIAAIANYLILANIGSGDLYALNRPDAPPSAGFVGAIVPFFETILKQDFFLFLVMGLALAGVLQEALPVIAIGGVITMVHSSLRTIRFFRQRG
jgi:phosphatidylglycerophosphate synthase